MQKSSKMVAKFRSTLWLVTITGLLINLNPVASLAQQATANRPVLHLADLMNSEMQVHHIKLWLAGHAGNWALAAYELAKIKHTIEEVKETIVDIQVVSPHWRRVPIGEMLKAFDTNLNSLNEAINAKDASKFEVTYNGLTGTCNACHASADQPQVKITVPSVNGSSAFSDQDFTGDAKN